ncbi:copper resistance protein CopC [Amycolatopsis nigrescens]|uniref:copper resistance CopC/CopD family protein n=1 Tax=Amycolatopsis nigrescens TaxID=381445 RepID=UPI00036FC985|nr:copper resistance protein CopC [Amycolatopsis nigrescens]
MTLVKDRPRGTKTSTGTSAAGLAFALLVAACWATLLAVASPVSTEVPVLRSTSPGAGVTARPDELVLTFDRPVPAGLATVRLTDPYHREIDPGVPTHPDGRADTISVPIPKQKYAGTYSVAWSVPTERLESVSGTFTFDLASRSSVQDAPQLATKPGTVVTVLYAVAQFGALAALALLVGAVFFVAVSWPAGASSKVARRVVKYAWAALAGCTLGALVLFGPYAAKLPLTDVFKGGLLSGTFESGVGATFRARLLLLVLTGISTVQFIASAPAKTTGERWLRGGAVLGCAAALVATWSFSGHSAPVPLSLAVDIVHLTTMAVLAGGLAMLCVIPRRKRELAEVPRFSRLALVSAGLLVVTGAYEFWRQVGGFAAVTTFPGWLWAAKVGLVVVLAVTVLAVRWWRSRRGPAVAGVVAAGLLLAVTTVLAISRPARVADAAARHQAPPARLEFDTGGQDGRGWLDLAVVPAKVGENEVHLSVLDRRLATATDQFAVTAVLSTADQSGKPIPLTRVGKGYSTGSVHLPGPGQWELALTFQSADGKQQTSYGVVDVT